MKQLLKGLNEAHANGFACSVWDHIWPHGIKDIFHLYSDHIPKILYIPNPRVDNSITNVEDVSKVPTGKKVSYDVCMFNAISPDGHEKTMDGETYPFPIMHTYLEKIYDAFGPNRMFWGTDITKMPCSWKQCVTMFTEEASWLRTNHHELVMGEALCNWWGWERSH